MNPLEWDSEFFGLDIARADLAAEPLDAALADARAAGIELLYVFAPGDRLPLVREAVLRGARPLELRSELDLALDAPPSLPAGVRLAAPADEPALFELADAFSASSRFRLDDRFPQERIAEMYRRWVRRCLDEGAVVVPSTEPAGFGGVRVADGVASYDLLYVAPGSRGGGTARELVLGGLAAVGATAARTTMQLSNLPVQRLFQRVGFRVAEVQVVLHLWLDEVR